MTTWVSKGKANAQHLIAPSMAVCRQLHHETQLTVVVVVVVSRWSTVRHGLEWTRRRETVDKSDASQWSRDVSGRLSEQVRAVAGLRLSQLPLNQQVVSTRGTWYSTDRLFWRPHPRCSLAVVEHVLYCCSINSVTDDKHFDWIKLQIIFRWHWMTLNSYLVSCLCFAAVTTSLSSRRILYLAQSGLTIYSRR